MAANEGQGEGNQQGPPGWTTDWVICCIHFALILSNQPIFRVNSTCEFNQLDEFSFPVFKKRFFWIIQLSLGLCVLGFLLASRINIMR